MRDALELARHASKMGEVPVGAVIVREGAVLSRAHNAPRAVKGPDSARGSARHSIRVAVRRGLAVDGYNVIRYLGTVSDVRRSDCFGAYSSGGIRRFGTEVWRPRVACLTYCKGGD